MATIYIVFFASLSRITNHGEEVKIPNVIGRDLNTAVLEIEKQGFLVDVDSVFELKKKSNIVLSQKPDTGSIVKRGRTIFITVNKAQAPLAPMPNLLNLSFRSAEMVLRSNKLRLGDTTYIPDIAKGAILEQRYEGKPVSVGRMIPLGSKIDLVIGDGLGNTEFDVPNTIGMSYMEAVAVLSANGLAFHVVWEGAITDSAMAQVYDQYPKALNQFKEHNRIKEGDIIDIRVKQGTFDDGL
ncbi:MAG: PASTA domain-containing protein [Flavipsychrobacter sp.]